MLGDATHSSPPGYRAFYSTPIDGQGHHGGTAIFVRTDVPSVPLQLQSPIQAVAAKVFLDRFYTICSIYLPPGAPVERLDLDALAHDLPSPFLLLGDFNGRHPLWDDSAINPRGVLLASFIEDEGLEVLNSGDVTHFHSQTGTFTSIVVSLCTSNSLLDFSWRVLPDLYGSDHFPILLETANSVPQSRSPRWRLDKADWHLFTQLTTSFRPLTDFDTCDEAAMYCANAIHSAAIQSIPKTKGQFPKRPVPWWNADCSIAIREKRAAFSRLRRHRGDPHCLEAFKQTRARTRRILKEAQRKSWKSYLSSINSRTPLTEVFNRVRKIAGKFSAPPPPVLSHVGETVADPKTVADLFAEHFASVSRKDPTAPGARYRQTSESHDVNFASPGGESYNVPFTVSEMQKALSQCHDSSPGPDDIPYAFLRHLSENAFNFLLNLYNLIWSTGDFPSSWGVAIVLPIPKPGKDLL